MNAQHGYSYNTNTATTADDWARDIFLGENNRQKKQNLEMLNEQNRFTEYMASTQHQRGVADMKAAGINPIIAASAGQSTAAAAPSSASANAGSVNSGLLGGAVAKLFNKVVDLPFKMLAKRGL